MCGIIVLSKKGMNAMRRTYLTLSEEDKDYLKTLSKKRTIQAQIVDRAKILLYKSDGMTFNAIAEKLAISSATVRLCVSKYYEGGIEKALFDTQRPGRPSEITDDAKAWIINLACQRPVELGYAQELWTLNALHKHIQKHAEEAGYPRLTTITKPYIQKFLKEQDIKPFKIRYYCEKRDPDFESKMHEVLLVYKQIEMQFDENGTLIVPDDYKLTITVSYDEKPGIQAISNTAPDLRPTAENGEVYRDAEYKRLGTLSLLAGIDLLTGEKPRLNLKSIVLFRTDYLCLILISTCWNWKRMRRSNRIGSLFQCWIFRYDKVECMGDRPSIRAKIAVDLFFVGRTDKVETMAGPRKI